MASNPVTLTVANQHDLTLSATKRGARPILVAPDGNIWSGEYNVARDADARVFLQDDSGKVLTTLTLPRPVRSKSSKDKGLRAVEPYDLVLDGDRLWISDFSWGVIYSYTVPATAVPTASATIYYESPASSQSNPAGTGAEYGAMALQKKGVDGKTDLLWVLDTQGQLVAFDATAANATKPAYNIPLNGLGQTLRALVYHEKAQTLWLIAQDKDNSPEGNPVWELLSLSVKTAPKVTDLKRYPLADAMTMALFDDVLYVGGVNGQIWRLDLSKAIPQTIAPMITVMRPGAGPATPITPFSLKVDAAGTIWVSDDISDDGGGIYGILPSSDGTSATVLVSYAPLQTPAKFAPGCIDWRSNKAGDGTVTEALYITDQELNGRVVKISPLPGVGAVDPDGTAAYTLEFVPKDGVASPEHSFGEALTPVGIMLRAHPKAPPADVAKDVAMNVVLEKRDESATVHTVLKNDPARTTLSASPFLAIVDFAVAKDSSEGKTTLTATGRGKTGATAIFNGTVVPAVTGVKLLKPDGTTDAPVRRTVQRHAFDVPLEDVIIATTPASTTDVTITLKGPVLAAPKPGDGAHFGTGSSASTTVKSGGTLPAIIAGTVAGDVEIDMTAAGLKTPSIVHWQVIPIPTELDVPGDTNISIRAVKAGTQMTSLFFTLRGRQRLGDTTTPLVSVPGWNVRMTLHAIDTVTFTGTGAAPDGKSLVVKTDASGVAVIPDTALKFTDKAERSGGEFSIDAVWHSDLEGDGEPWTSIPTGQKQTTKFTVGH